VATPSAKTPDLFADETVNHAVSQTVSQALAIVQPTAPASIPPALAGLAAQPSAATPITLPLAPSLEALHPALWRAHQLGRQAVSVLASGFAALDAQLPGGGWPAGTLTELLLPHPGIGELRLLAPVLRQLQQQQQRCLMWFDPPTTPCAWALASLGLDVQRLVVVHAASVLALAAAGQDTAERARNIPGTQGQPTRQKQHQPQNKPTARSPAADSLWALEQALKSGHLGAVLAWLPARLPADALRRLQLAAQGHDGPVFLLRADSEARRASAAPLRLLLASAGPDLLQVHLFKRRGPPLAQPLVLSLPAVLSAPALSRALRPGRVDAATAAGPSKSPGAQPVVPTWVS